MQHAEDIKKAFEKKYELQAEETPQVEATPQVDPAPQVEDGKKRQRVEDTSVEAAGEAEC